MNDERERYWKDRDQKHEEEMNEMRARLDELMCTIKPKGSRRSSHDDASNSSSSDEGQ